jgi:hypothetical protein
MERRNQDYDWLRPPDSAFQEAISRIIDGQASAFAPYVYKCGSLFGCSAEFRYGKKRSLGRLLFATPIRLAAEDMGEHWSQLAASPAAQEARSKRGIFAVSLVVQARKRADKPSVGLQAGERTLLPVEIKVSGRRMENCWVDREEKCWRSVYTAFFALEDGASLTGTGSVLVRWAKEETAVPLNFDYLW